MAIMIMAAALLAACNREPDPYLAPGDQRGTPADRTGGAATPESHGNGQPGTERSQSH